MNGTKSFWVVLMVMLAGTAAAQEPSTAVKEPRQVNIDISASMIVGAPEFTYVYAGASTPLVLHDRFLFIAGAGVEYAPIPGHAGGMAWSAMSWFVGGRTSIDAVSLFIHDQQIGAGRDGLSFFTGLGPGASVVLESGVIVSASAPYTMQLIPGVGVAPGGWSPGVNIAFPL